MRNRSLIVVAGLLVVLFVFTGVVYAFDSTRAGRVAKGITVSGVDIGGLTRAQARDTLRRAVLTPLNQPVTITSGDLSYTLTAEDAGVGVDLDGSVEAAIKRSRNGNAVSRAFREITGGRVSADVPVDVTYSEPAIDRLIRRISKEVERPAVDAHINLEEGDVTPRPSRNGVRIRAARLKREIAQRLITINTTRTVRVRTGVVKPKTTTAELGRKHPTVLIVNRGNFTLRLYKGLRHKKTYRIAVGQVGMDTPAGLYHVQNKAENPAWHVPDSEWAGKLRGKIIPPDDPRNPIEARWMGIYDGAGIHGTTAENSIGTAASHGCIRMRIPDVIELYEQVEAGAPVYIA